MIPFDTIKNKVKEVSAQYGISEYEIYFSEDSSVSCETYRDEISAFSSTVSGLLLYRAIVDGKVGYASTESSDIEEIEALVSHAIENARCIEKEEKAIIFGGVAPNAYHTVPQNAFVMPGGAAVREEAMTNRNILYAADCRIADGTECGAYGEQTQIRLYNANGLDLSASVGSVGSYMVAVLEDGDEKQEYYDMLYNRFGAEDAVRRSLAETVIDGAQKKFHAGTVKTGIYNIVFDHKQMAAILATFSSCFFAEKVQKGLSLLRGKCGEKIASDCVTLLDDPFFDGNPMQMPFDGEGVPTKTKTVIENGVLKTYLYNLASADKDGVESTGNASRSASSIGTRVFTFYIKPGTLSTEELLSKAENGIYINEMKGFHAGANAVTGDFSIESAGMLIENGKLTRPVKSFTVAGNFFTLLKSVTALDNVLDTRAPAVSRYLSPDVLVPAMSVAGEN